MNKKNYIQPSVESTQLMPSTIVLAGSPGISFNPAPIDNNEND